VSVEEINVSSTQYILTLAGLAFGLYITTESVRRDSLHLLRFGGYMVVMHSRARWNASKRGASEQRSHAKVRPLRICRLACPGLLDLAFRPMTSLRFRLWYCPNIWFTSIHRSELLSIGTLMIGRFSGDASICSCSWEGEHSRTIRHESIS
jgi:hypothetical protein